MRYTTDAWLAASKKNALQASNVRAARAILKALPIGAQPGDRFVACQRKHLTVIDPVPVKTTSVGDDGQTRIRWAQRFEQSGQVKVYGIAKVFSGVIRIVWDYEPTLENIMDAPNIEEKNNDSK